MFKQPDESIDPEGNAKNDRATHKQTEGSKDENERGSGRHVDILSNRI